MKTPTRYHMTIDGARIKPVPHEIGEWMKHCDAAALQEENARLREALGRVLRGTEWLTDEDFDFIRAALALQHTDKVACPSCGGTGEAGEENSGTNPRRLCVRCVGDGKISISRYDALALQQNGGEGVKAIEREEWEAMYQLRSGVEVPELDDDSYALDYFDNGAVRTSDTGDFIVKCDQVTTKEPRGAIRNS
jgi:hypothetical protein